MSGCVVVMVAGLGPSLSSLSALSTSLWQDCSTFTLGVFSASTPHTTLAKPMLLIRALEVWAKVHSDHCLAKSGSRGERCVRLEYCFFFLGFSAGYPFYVPQSLFAVEFGAADAATVVGCGECLQSVFAAAFILTGQRYAVVDDVTDWVKICSFISGAAAIGFVLMVLFMYESMRAADKRRGKTEKAA
mmetsp:Transcript_56818/g.112216  ORF Transcript_56818/g.112216 Transcript_56818/m.112216 type:complete len:188 (+) Transcript_56818:354-917(+)